MWGLGSFGKGGVRGMLKGFCLEVCHGINYCKREEEFIGGLDEVEKQMN